MYSMVTWHLTNLDYAYSVDLSRVTLAVEYPVESFFVGLGFYATRWAYDATYGASEGETGSPMFMVVCLVFVDCYK